MGDREVDFNEMGTITAEGEQPLTAEIGGGLSGFGGVAVSQPQSTERGHREVALYPERYKDSRLLGIGFAYDDTARVCIGGVRRWVNKNLRDAPRGRQDVLETGVLKIELFDTEGMRTFIERYRKDIEERLGLKFLSNQG